MTHFITAETIPSVQSITPVDAWSVTSPRSLLVVRDNQEQRHEFIETVCGFLNVSLEYATGEDDIGRLLGRKRPMAVIARLEGEYQDGFHVMKVISGYDCSIPVLLLSDNDPRLLGAVDAVQETWGLRNVTTLDEAAGIGALAEYLFDVAHEAGMSGLMRV